MKYLCLFLCLLCTLVFSACSFVKPNQFQDSGEVGLYWENKYKEEDLGDFHKWTASDWIPEGYTGAIVVITEANSGAIVIQTGDQLLYRNEIYGFQILLGEDWKGVQIKEWEPYQEANIINFHVNYRGKEGDFESNFPIFILSPQTFYDEGRDTYNEDLSDKRQNNKYFFRAVNGGISNTIISYFFPSLECKKVIEYGSETTICENWLNSIFKDFSAFEI